MKIMSTAMVAGAALLASATLTIAQQEKGPPGSGSSSPPAGAEPRGAAPSERATPPGATQERGPGASTPGKSAEPRERSEPKQRATEPKERAEPKQRAAEPKERGESSKQKAAEPKDRPAAKGAERESDRKSAEPREPGKQDKRATERGPDGKGPATTERPDQGKKAEGPREGKQAQKHDEARSARTRLSSEQRTGLRTKFDVRGARAGGAKFTVRLGTSVPRRVRLYAVPAAVVAIVPAYAAYRYVVVEDEIIIVDPVSYEIVDVIDERSQTASRPERVELRLSADQRMLVIDSVARDFPPADVRIRLALGAEIPASVELHAFPDPVIDRVPELRDYRFIIAERDVVVVHPGDRSIALVIEQR